MREERKGEWRERWEGGRGARERESGERESGGKEEGERKGEWRERRERRRGEKGTVEREKGRKEGRVLIEPLGPELEWESRERERRHDLRY